MHQWSKCHLSPLPLRNECLIFWWIALEHSCALLSNDGDVFIDLNISFQLWILGLFSVVKFCLLRNQILSMKNSLRSRTQTWTDCFTYPILPDKTNSPICFKPPYTYTPVRITPRQTSSDTTVKGVTETRRLFTTSDWLQQLSSKSLSVHHNNVK
jgi:hypothetical protein